MGRDKSEKMTADSAFDFLDFFLLLEGFIETIFLLLPLLMAVVLSWFLSFISKSLKYRNA